MTPQDITHLLQTRFGDSASKMDTPDAWQVETPEMRLLVLFTNSQTWLRLLVPIVPIAEAQPFLGEILEANFEQTHMAHYASYDNNLWGIFRHKLATLEAETFMSAIDQLLAMKEAGVSPFFNTLIETRVRQIIHAAKLQGQSLENTMQLINRFYAEGIMGDMKDSDYGDRALAAWQRQLERLWSEVNPSESAKNE
ncbi:hypothetical protein [Adonisia turfae]|uniref:Uncharacterized protein n=1 Tax=Adonisia turfae CCMR0081 TaxID=2292702 RepID=A0A6M0RI88_9CYAN|nr:hypothetical protein [Adonisia turfae]NEZ55967.1 hypothetical protein [Adonisia turfae CCMR0081]